MSDPYGTCSWTCGRCGETFSAGGSCGDLKVNRWAADHREWHRVQDMTPEDRAAHYARQAEIRLMAHGRECGSR